MGSITTALYALQQIDTRIAEVERQLAELDDGSALRAQLDTLRETAASEAGALHAAEKELLDTELKMKSLEEKKKDFERRMYGGHVSNPKELGDMQREVQMLGRSVSELEDKALVLMDQIEERRRTVAEAQRDAQETEQQLAQVVERFERESARCRAELAELAAQREPAAAAPPRDALKRYEDLRPRRANLAVVLVSGGVCQGCHVAVASDQVRELKRQNLLRNCDNCGRILHLPDD